MGFRYTGKRSVTLRVAVASVLGLAPPILLAQAESEGLLDEVLVTASRRSESIQEVPLNIVAVGGAQIQEQGISNLVDISRAVPGFFVLDQGPRASNAIIVRGLNADPVGATEFLGNAGGGTVATYVGEIPLYIDMKLEDVERVEVLLGPQGTLYGAGTLGGAVRYLPRRPQFDSTDVQLRANTFALAHAESLGAKGGVTFNVPLADNLAFRMSADYLDDPGFIDYNYVVRTPGVSDADPDPSNPAAVAANLRRVEDADYQKTLSGRAALRWQIGDSVDANLTHYYQNQEVGARTVNHRTSMGTGRYESALRYLEPNERENHLTALEVTADLGFAELTSATGYSRFESRGQRDQTDLLIGLDYSYELFPSFSAYTTEHSEEKTLNQEVRLVSQSDGPLNWIVGGYYNKLQRDGVGTEITPGYSQYLIDIGVAGGVLRPDALEYWSEGHTKLEEKALYGELSYDITDRWQVTVGGRYYEYDLKTRDATDLPLLFTTIIGDRGPNDVILDFEHGGQADDGTLFKFNTSYQFTDDIMAYVTLSEGYRIGNSNGVPLCDDTVGEVQNVCGQPAEFEYFPDSTTNYELGLRTQWLDGRLTLNGSVYHVDWKDPQLSTQTAVGNQPVTINGKGAQTRGLELTFDMQFTPEFSINGSYGYANAELSEDAPRLMRMIDPPGFGVTFVDGQAGDRLPGSPEHQGNVSANWEMPVFSTWDLSLTYGISAVSDVLTRVGGRGGGESLPGFVLHNASATLKGEQWGVGLYARNLFDKYAEAGARLTSQYAQTLTDDAGGAVRVRTYHKDIVRPREIGLRVTYDFGL